MDELEGEESEVAESQTKQPSDDESEVEESQRKKPRFSKEGSIAPETSSSPNLFKKKSRKSVKRALEDKEMSVLETMSRVVEGFEAKSTKKSEDHFDVFAKNIANKLRQITDVKLRMNVEYQIETICFKALMGNQEGPSIGFGANAYAPPAFSPQNMNAT